MRLSGTGVWSIGLEFGEPGAANDAAAELEELGYSAIWIPDGGPALFPSVERLLTATRSMVVASGILSLWQHTPPETAAATASLAAEVPDRFLLGIGVSHASMVDAQEPGRYRRPLAAMAGFLDGLDACEPPVPADRRVLAALGPKMLELAAVRSAGVHPYLVTPEHTRLAREAVGAEGLVLPEQTVALCSTREEAQALGTEWLRGYLGLPNYVNNLLRLGFTQSDVDEVSVRLFDAMIAWGDEETIMQRIEEHRAAGADHVAIQVLVGPDPRVLPMDAWRRLAGALV